MTWSQFGQGQCEYLCPSSDHRNNPGWFSTSPFTQLVTDSQSKPHPVQSDQGQVTPTSLGGGALAAPYSLCPRPSITSSALVPSPS